MTDKTTATGSPMRPQDTELDALRGREVASDARPVDLLRAPEGELRRFAQVNAAKPKRPRAGLRPRFVRDW